jgi:hypothetical protein
MAIHTLDVMSRKPANHMTAADMSLAIETVRRAAREQFERETTILQAEVPVSLFEGMTVADIQKRVFHRLANLVTHSERMVVQRHDGTPVLRSPLGMVPQVPTAMLTVRWYDASVPDVVRFWELVRSYEAIQAAIEVRLDFPGGTQVVLKDRRNPSTNGAFIPVKLGH